MELPSLPFVIPNVYEGLAVARGMARASRGGLILEFEVKDSLVGMIRSGVREIQIAIDDLDRLDLRKGWFRTRLFVRTRRMVTLDKVPGHQAGIIELRIKREDRAAAQALVSQLMLMLSERELERLTAGDPPPIGVLPTADAEVPSQIRSGRVSSGLNA